MIFSSFEFLYLLLITLLLFYIPFIYKAQKYILILASFIFYSFNIPAIFILLLTSIFLNSSASYIIQSDQSEKIKKSVLIIGIILNLLMLIFYKYKVFFIDEGSLLYESQSINLDTLYRLTLPIGISFYTFQAISLLVDFYKGKYSFKKEKSYLLHSVNIALYLSFFPQLIAGPIVKAHDFIYQIKIKKIKDINFDSALTNIIFGYFLKMVIADNLSLYVTKFNMEVFQVTSSIDLILYLISYSFYVLSDFAGYSYIAIGIGYLFGYKLPDNFNFPFLAKNFSDFWKRWHISLSQWLSEYLYIPLGGNRKGMSRTLINLMLTMTIGGLWHGSSWGFALWGFLHGCVLVIERVMPFKFPLNKYFDFFRIFRTYSIWTSLLLFFHFDDISTIKEYIRAVINNTDLPLNSNDVGSMLTYCLMMLCIHVFHKYIAENKKLVVRRYSYLFYAILLLLIFSDHGSQYDFLYYRF